jgi:hypothetical protein
VFKLDSVKTSAAMFEDMMYRVGEGGSANTKRLLLDGFGVMYTPRF